MGRAPWFSETPPNQKGKTAVRIEGSIRKKLFLWGRISKLFGRKKLFKKILENGLKLNLKDLSIYFNLFDIYLPDCYRLGLCQHHYHILPLPQGRNRIIQNHRNYSHWCGYSIRY